MVLVICFFFSAPPTYSQAVIIPEPIDVDVIGQPIDTNVLNEPNVHVVNVPKVEIVEQPVKIEVTDQPVDVRVTNQVAPNVHLHDYFTEVLNITTVETRVNNVEEDPVQSRVVNKKDDPVPSIITDILDHSLIVEKPVPVVNVYKKCTPSGPRCNGDALFGCVGGGVIEKGEDKNYFYWRCQSTCIPGDPIEAAVNLNHRQSGPCKFQKPLCGKKIDTPEGRWTCENFNHLRHLEQEIVEVRDSGGAEVATIIYDRWQCGRSTGGDVSNVVFSDICKKIVPVETGCDSLSDSLVNKGSCMSFGGCGDKKDTCAYDKNQVVESGENSEYYTWSCIGDYDTGLEDESSGNYLFWGGLPYYTKDYVTASCRASKIPMCDETKALPDCLSGNIEDLRSTAGGWTWLCVSGSEEPDSCSKSRTLRGASQDPPNDDDDDPTVSSVEVEEVASDNIQASRNANGDEITLLWSLPQTAQPIEKYQYSVDNGETWVDIPDSDASTTSYTILSLNPNIEYLVRVRAVLSDEDGGQGEGQISPLDDFSGTSSNVNACGSREDRLQASVPDFFYKKENQYGCKVESAVPAFGGKYRKTDCILGNVVQEDATFIISRKGGHLNSHLLVYVTCRFGTEGESGEEDDFSPSQGTRTERLTVRLLPHQETVSFSVDGEIYPDSSELEGIPYGDAVQCVVEQIAYDKNLTDIGPPSFVPHILDEGAKSDTVVISRIEPQEKTLASVLRGVMRKNNIPEVRRAPERREIVGAAVYLTYLWGHYTGLIRMPRHSIEGLLSSPAASIVDTSDYGEKMLVLMENRDNEDLQRYQVLNHLFASESDPRFRLQNFGLMIPKEAQDEYVNSYEDKLKYHAGTSIGNFMFKVPAAYR